MPQYFIEMGQGLFAKGDFSVRTSTLFSCALLAGRNEVSGVCGAFHYPAGGLLDAEIQGDMDIWVNRFRPSLMVVVFGTLAADSQARHDDEERVKAWAGRGRTARAMPDTNDAVMLASDESMIVGSVIDVGRQAPDWNLLEDTDDRVVDLSVVRAGQRGDYTLVGKNREVVNSRPLPHPFLQQGLQGAGFAAAGRGVFTGMFARKRNESPAAASSSTTFPAPAD